MVWSGDYSNTVNRRAIGGYKTREKRSPKGSSSPKNHSPGAYGMGAGVQTVNTLQPGQQNILGAGSDLMTQLLEGNTPEGYHPFAPYSPDQAVENYDQFFRPAAEAQFENKVMPQIAESHVGPGTYWGGARAAAESDARTSFENSQMQNIGQMFQQDRNRAMGLLPFGSAMAGLNTGVTFGQQQGSGDFGLGNILQQLLGRMGLGNQAQGQGQAQGQAMGGGGNILEEMGINFRQPEGPNLSMGQAAGNRQTPNLGNLPMNPMDIFGMGNAPQRQYSAPNPVSRELLDEPFGMGF